MHKICASLASFAEYLQGARNRLLAPQIGKYEQLQEWKEDFEEPGHRHLSHLFGLYPGDQITLEHTPELTQAARRSLERRLEHGGGHTGWSRAWVIALWACLRGSDSRDVAAKSRGGDCVSASIACLSMLWRVVEVVYRHSDRKDSKQSELYK